MSNIVLLTRLQVMETIGALRASVEKRTGANGALAATVLLALLIMGGLGWLGYMAFEFLGRPQSSKGIYDILFLSVGTLTFIFSLPMVLSSFFASSDITDLLPLPVTPLSIVFSKAVSALFSSYLWTFAFIAGPLAGWGIASGAGVHFWVTYIFSVLFAPLMPTAYAGILSIVIASVFKRLRRKDAITTVTTVLALGFAILMHFAFTQVSNSNTPAAEVVNNMAASMGGIVMAFPAYGFAVYALEHVDPLGILLFVGISLLSFAVFVLVARLLYLRVVTSLSAGGAKAGSYDASQSKASSSTLVLLLTAEVKKIVRNSSVALNYVVYPAVISPVILVVLSSSGSFMSLFSSGEADLNVLGPLLMIVLMLYIVIAASGNKLCITGISREGSNWVHLKYLPVPASTQILAKVIPGFAVNAFISLFILLYVGVTLVGSGLSIVVLLSAIITMLAYSWLSCCVGIHYDCCDPRIDWGNDGDVNIKTLGGGGGTFRCFALGIPFAAAPVLSFVLNIDGTIVMCGLAVVSVALAYVLGNMLLKAAARRLESLE